MNHISALHPDESALRALLADAAPPGVAEHVDGCEICQQRLDDWARMAEGDWAAWLADPTRPATPEPPLGDAGEAEFFQLSHCTSDRLAAPPELAEALPTPPKLTGYVVERVLGRGGMGVVYLAREEALNRLVALKMLPSHAQATDPDAVVRMVNEAESAARICHPHVVQIYSVGRWAGQPYLACEYVPGGTLAARLNGQPLPARAAAQLVWAIARGVAAAHAVGVLHRDLKPGNILLDAQDQPKIADFGLAKRLDLEQHLTRTGVILGTPSYMAPEQADGKGRVDTAADIWAVGAILYECLTGRPPFLGPTSLETILQVQTEEPVPPRRLVPATPLDLEIICLTCLRKEPARRYGSAAALAEDLERYLNDQSIRARATSTVEKIWRWCRRNRLAASGLFAAFLSLLVGLVTASLLYWRAESLRWRAVAGEIAARQGRDQAYQALMAVTSAAALEELVRAYELSPEQTQFLTEAADAFQQLAAGAIDDQERLAQVHERLAQVQLALGRLESALLAARSAVAIRASGSAADPMALANSRMRLAEVLTRLGQIREAEIELRAARAMLVARVDADPSLRASVALCHYRLGLLRWPQPRRWREAEANLIEARNLWTALQPAADFRRELAEVESELGRLLSTHRRPAEAEPHLRRALELWQTLAHAAPHSLPLRAALAEVWSHLGALHTVSDQPQQAEAAYLQASQLLEQVVTLQPGHIHYRRLWIGLTHRRATLCLDQERPAAARALYDQVFRLTDELAARAPRHAQLTIIRRNAFWGVARAYELERQSALAANAWSAAAVLTDLTDDRLTMLESSLLTNCRQADDYTAQGYSLCELS